jgi:hypothetical protein
MRRHRVRAEGKKGFKGKKPQVSFTWGIRQRVINPNSLTTKAWPKPPRSCTQCHWTRDDSYHRLGPRRFAEVHQLNIRAIVARLSARPIIWVESGTFVGRFGDQGYELGSTAAGLALAIRRMSELRREREAEVA